MINFVLEVCLCRINESVLAPTRTPTHGDFRTLPSCVLVAVVCKLEPRGDPISLSRWHGWMVPFWYYLLLVLGRVGQQRRDVEHDLVPLEERVHRVRPGLVLGHVQAAAVPEAVGHVYME